MEKDIKKEALEAFCEEHGFEFHASGRGRWAIHPYWSYAGIDFCPYDLRVRIEGRLGKYEGMVESLKHFMELLKALQIEADKLDRPEQRKLTKKFKMERKMDIANRVAVRIEREYGFRPDKAFDMAIHGEWWTTLTRLSLMSNRIDDELVAEVMADIDSGKII